MSRHRDYRLRKQYGLTSHAADILTKGAGNRCMICRRSPKKGERLCIDHCHRTGVVRGVLCRECNLVLGGMRDNPKLLRAAADYLEKSHVPVRLRPNAPAAVRVVRKTKRRRKATLSDT